MIAELKPKEEKKYVRMLDIYYKGNKISAKVSYDDIKIDNGVITVYRSGKIIFIGNIGDYAIGTMAKPKSRVQ